jgi:undecaprenyl-diphosphatase
VDTLEAIVLGIVQGLTEFLPISSSGHLRIVPAFAGWEDPGAAFTAVVQLGTMAAVLLYFRKDLWGIARGLLAGLRDPAARSTLEWRLGLFIILGTIPISVIGLALADTIETDFRTLELLGVMLIVAGLILAWSERFRTERPKRQVEEITARDVAVIGFAQAAALIPGVSRSGATMSAGLFLGLDRVAAARFSFLLSVPAVVLSGLFELRHIGDGDGYGLGPTIAGTVLAFLVGYASIAWLLKFITRHSFNVFVGYRLILGGVVIALAAAGTIN